jgi:hypothetical protein
VDLPECEQDGLSIYRLTIPKGDLHNALLGGRSTRPGTYTALKLNGRLWMSDTDAEKRDHMPAVWKIDSLKAKRVLSALSFDHVEHVDVVEIDERVVSLVGAHYAKDSRVHVHHADAYEQMSRWPVGTRWDVAWSDIWPDICLDNLEDMTRLRRSYGRRTEWHDCWSRDELLRLQRRDKKDEKYREVLRSWASRIMQ